MIKISTYTRAYEACEAFFTKTGQMPTIDAIKPIILKKSVEFNPAENIQHKFDKPIGGMS